MGQETKTNEDIRITELKNSPIYTMSLGSKELFHSNFWAWLMEQNKEFAKVFFPEIDVNSIKKDGIKREFKLSKNSSLDIVIFTEKGCYVIENKIKSLPTNEQLKRYKAEMEADKKLNFQKGLLTGMQSEMPKHISREIRKDWKFLSYKEIAVEIRARLDLLNDEKYRTVTEMYCDDLDNLCNIISDKLQHSDFNSWSFDDAEDLKDIRFDDAYKKLKSDKLKLKLKEELERRGYKDGDPAKSNKNFTFKIETNFTAKNPVISFKYIYNYKDSVTGVYSIGVQIQDNNFRRHVETEPDGINQYGGGYDGFFDTFADMEWFDKAYSKGTDTIHLKTDDITEYGHDTNMDPRKGNKDKKNKNNLSYNAYNDFIYQHFLIKENNFANLNKLADEIKKHMEYAETKLKDAEKVFKELENK